VYEEMQNRYRQPLMIVISGPSGVGKDSIVKRMKARGLPFHFVVTATSRQKRADEVNGVDYFFVSPDQFQEMIAKDELIEHALVYGQHKGIPKKQVKDALSSGKDVILRIDIQGAETIRSLYPQAILIFVSAASEEALISRLTARKTEAPKDLQVRIDTARKELSRVDLFDYYVVNEDGKLDKTVNTIVSIIECEHHRTQPRKVTL
jgi:guanylate kinase